jgi:hypothetical protein
MWKLTLGYRTQLRLFYRESNESNQIDNFVGCDGWNVMIFHTKMCK